MEALAPFVCGAHYPQDPKPLPYLQDKADRNYNVALQVERKKRSIVGFSQHFFFKVRLNGDVISNTNMKYLYWTAAQMIAHHSVTGCNLRAGDLFGSGTISGPTPQEYGR